MKTRRNETSTDLKIAKLVVEKRLSADVQIALNSPSRSILQNYNMAKTGKQKIVQTWE